MATLTLPIKPAHSRILALALLVVALLLALAVLLAPVLLLHRHYDVAIDSLQDRL